MTHIKYVGLKPAKKDIFDCTVGKGDPLEW